MRLGFVLAMAAAVSSGCFEEGGDAAQTEAVSTLVQGLIAFGDIHSNIETDPGKAAEALLEFIKWPVAADSLVSPPFAGADTVMAEARLAPALPVPDCLLQDGEPACDAYRTIDTCEAGGFTFRGWMNRKCSKCDDPRGLCAYGWLLPQLRYSSARFTVNMATSGSWVGSVSQVTPNLTAVYDLTVAGFERRGVISACACTVFTVVDSPTTTGKPRKLVNSSFIVRAHDFLDIVKIERCALVEFDGNGNPSISSKCACANGSVCSAPDPRPADVGNGECGDGICSEINLETYESCPVDCPLNPAVCGNGVCEIGESLSTCPEDCEFP